MRLKPFSVLCADPPWSFNDVLPGPGRGSEKHYQVLSQGEIERFPLPPIADDAILFLWRVASQIEEAARVVRAWGFVPKSEIVWVKLTSTADRKVLKRDLVIPRGTPAMEVRNVARRAVPQHFGMGRYVRAGHETCIVAARGRASSLILDHSIRSTFEAPIGRHSKKPEAFYDLVEKLARGPYAELFARRSRPGWQCFGNEL